MTLEPNTATNAASTLRTQIFSLRDLIEFVTRATDDYLGIWAFDYTCKTELIYWTERPLYDSNMTALIGSKWM